MPVKPRILLFGIDCYFTIQVLSGLLKGSADVVGLALPGPPGVGAPIPVRTPSSSIQLAGAAQGIVSVVAHHAIPAYRLGDLTSDQTTATLTALNANLLICACFPTIIPRRITRLFPNRAVNIHPSLLPEKRGPDPLFWTFREGTGHSGITIHDLSPRFDAGAIVGQRAYVYADGTTEAELEATLAAMAVEMVLDLMPSLLRDNVQRQPQDESAASYAPLPRVSDFSLDRSMSARAAFNFVRGVSGRGIPITIRHESQTMQVTEVVSIVRDESSDADTYSALEFNDGFLLARLEPLEG